MKENERGAALLMVLVALAVLLPLMATLSDLVWMRQRQALAFRLNLSGQAATRGAFHVAIARLAEGRIVLEPYQEDHFDLDELGSRAVSVRVSRERDAVVTAEGKVLEGEDAPSAGSAGGGQGQTIGESRRFEVYLIEAECRAPRPFPSVRLLGVVGRIGSQFVSLGVRYDRSYRR